MRRRAETVQAAVLTLLRTRRAPLSAYELLAALRVEGLRLAPTTVYRALTALVEAGAIRRLESCNAFVARRGEGAADPAILSICDACGAVEETVCARTQEALKRAAARTGFTASRHVIEIMGRCADCEATATAVAS